jgi:phospho-N-acetylmuramoyl-pentapeptide-transferase
MHFFESNPGTGLRAHEKLLIQGLTGGILAIWIFKLYGGLLWIPFLGTYDIGLWMIPFTIVTFMGTVNAVNISDGMDGLAGGMGVISVMALTVVAFFSGLFSTTLLGTSAVGALTTYMYFNIKPARVQMGDTGSFALGALITILAFSISKPLLLMFAAFPFFLEIGSTILQALSRRIFGRRVLQMAPLHHHFEMIGWNEEKVVVRFWLFSIACALVALWVSFF